ncbi:hypothetical protein [Streptococcus cristatus]|uniref:hypothetical protein n=1 Tax=Streptococcus cristatus TaxID=45634 RepID=UPI0005EE12D1|nr:hypothetical protein [Streptococcus cristatus]KJQ57927.1 lipoprotein [Streptococcus cristatus]QIP48743.1 hypothetical protein HBA50_01495 [Streptococcus cristatus ATCC 51100]
MRNIFDKLEGISVFVRSGIILILAAILISGLLFLKPAQKNTGSTKNVSYSRRSSSSDASSTNQASSEDNTIQNAEAAVKKIEEERTDESLAQAQAAVDKVKDEGAKAKFQGRIQAVKDAMKAPEESSEPESDQQPAPSPAPAYVAPAVVNEVPAQPQENHTPAPSTSSEHTPSSSSTLSGA